MHGWRTYAGAGALAMTMAATPAGASTVAYWRFDNDGKTAGQTAGTVGDETGNHDGTGSNSPTYSSDVFAGTVPTTSVANALSMDFERDSTETISVPHDAALSFGSSAFTIEAWVKLETLGDTADDTTRAYVLQKKGDAGNDRKADYTFMVQIADRGTQATPGVGKQSGFTGNELGYHFGDGGSNQYFIISNLEITDTDWHFVSMAFDGSDEVRFNVDSAFETVTGLSSLGHAGNTGDLIIAARTDASAVIQDPFDGKIDEIRISSGVVPTDQLLNAGPSVPVVSAWGIGSLALLVTAGGAWGLRRKS